MKPMNFYLKKMVDSAVSPVVGVMLMLIVVVIIAAVVSGFSGSLLGNTEKAPTLSMDVHISNNGYWSGSAFSARVTGVEKGVSTKDLKLVTSWSKTNSTGVHIAGGNTVVPGVNNTFVYLSPSSGCDNKANYMYIAPQGFGTGVGEAGGGSSTGPSTGGSTSTSFGNYDLMVGTSMYAQPYGETARPTSGGHTSTSYDVGYGVGSNRWSYTTGSSTTTCAMFYTPATNSLPADATPDSDMTSIGSYDSMTAVLGSNWYNLRAGDKVTVSIIHTPSGKTIWQKDVIVED